MLCQESFEHLLHLLLRPQQVQWSKREFRMKRGVCLHCSLYQQWVQVHPKSVRLDTKKNMAMKGLSLSVQLDSTKKTWG